MQLLFWRKLLSLWWLHLPGLLLAFIYQKRLQTKQDKKYIIATLMAYRFAGPDEVDFVKALNMVDIVFHSNKKVRDLLHKYFEYTGSNIYSGGHRVTTFFEMLLEMGRDIGYKDLKHSDLRNFYTPNWKPTQEPPETDKPEKA